MKVVAAAKLIGLFTNHAYVSKVLFNDSTIPYVRFAAGHNDHFHVELL